MSLPTIDVQPRAHDMRNWERHHPVFVPWSAIYLFLPDETDVIELGPRVACTYVRDVMADGPRMYESRYCR